MSSSTLLFKVEYAKSNRSKCNTTQQKIPAGGLRLATMVKSRHYDGLQAVWHKARAFLTSTTKKSKNRPKPQTVDEIEGFDDIRPDDQEKIEKWITSYTGRSARPSSEVIIAAQPLTATEIEAKKEQEQLKVQVDEQFQSVQEIEKITTKSRNRLPAVFMKSILQHNHLPVLQPKPSKPLSSNPPSPYQDNLSRPMSQTDFMAKVLSECVVFGVPPNNNGKEPYFFSHTIGKYVYMYEEDNKEDGLEMSIRIKDVKDVVCVPLQIPTPIHPTVQDWLNDVNKTGCELTAPFPQRLFVERSYKPCSIALLDEDGNAKHAPKTAATATAGSNGDPKVKMNKQLSLVWQVRDLTSKNSSSDKLSAATIKSILEANNIPTQQASATVGGTASSSMDYLVKALAEAVVFGVPTNGDTNQGCCGSKPLHFSPLDGRYVCRAPSAWGECMYDQSVEETQCKPIIMPDSTKLDPTVIQGWLSGIAKLGCGLGSKPRHRIYIQRKRKSAGSAAAALMASSRKKQRSLSSTTPKEEKGPKKTHYSRARVDPKSTLHPNYHVLDEGYFDGKGGSKKADPTEAFPLDLYDTTLCSTDLSTGTNSQYKLQILIHDLDYDVIKKYHPNVRKGVTTYPFYLWRKWGRVGNTGGGGTKLDRYTDLQSVKDEFHKLYKKQTGNDWINRKNFVKQPGKFFQMDISYDDDKDEDGNNDISSKLSSNANAQQVVAGDPNSKLSLRVQEVIASMFDKGIVMSQLQNLQIDVNKMPLGKMTEMQLRDAYSVLTQIEQILSPPASAQPLSESMKVGKLRQLSNQFYTKCPTTDPKLIDSMAILKQKVEMVDELINLQASNAVQDGQGDKKKAATRKAPIDEAYEKLNTELTPLDPTGDEFLMLNQYVENTRNATIPGSNRWGGNDWGRRGLRLLDAFTVEREGEAARFESKKHLGNRRLLWHGSRISNYTGILSQGLRIAPPEAPCSGYRFGKGVYFADMLGKSANYCRTNGSPEMFIMACDVSLGKTFETPRDKYMEKPQPGTNSTHALSEIVPDPGMSLEMSVDDDDKSDDNYPSFKAATGAADTKDNDKILVPLGKPTSSNLTTRPSCDVSEFIVYDQAQVHIRYLLRLTTNPDTKAADGVTGDAGTGAGGGGATTAAPKGTVRPRLDLTGTSSRRATKKQKTSTTTSATTATAGVATAKSVGAFIGLDDEDSSIPSKSGLDILNCRTFVEGLRLTVVQGDIATSKTQAIVVPSDRVLSLSGMVGQAVQKKAGPSFVDEIQRTDKLKVATVTTRTPPLIVPAVSAPPAPPAPQSSLPSNLKRIDTTSKNGGKTIRDLATIANTPYLTPFYKVIKKEDVSATKDIIVLNSNAGQQSFYRGQDARTFLSMPGGKKTSITLAMIPAGVEVFVQSSSHTRKIPANSSIVLETSATASNNKKNNTATPVTTTSTTTMTSTSNRTLLPSDTFVIGGHNLFAKHVIFVVSPVYSHYTRQEAEKVLKQSVKNCLSECAKLGYKTVTLPSIGSGNSGYDKGEAAKWIISAIADYLEEASTAVVARINKKQSIEEVCFCLFDQQSLDAYKQGILAHDSAINGGGGSH